MRLLLLLLLCGCTKEYVKPTNWEDIVIVQVHRTNTLKSECRDVSEKAGRTVMKNTESCYDWQSLPLKQAVAVMESAIREKPYILKCDIWVPPLKYNMDNIMMLWGHEVSHCFHGYFHR